MGSSHLIAKKKKKKKKTTRSMRGEYSVNRTEEFTKIRNTNFRQQIY